MTEPTAHSAIVHVQPEHDNQFLPKEPLASYSVSLEHEKRRSLMLNSDQFLNQNSQKTPEHPENVSAELPLNQQSISVLKTQKQSNSHLDSNNQDEENQFMLEHSSFNASLNKESKHQESFLKGSSVENQKVIIHGEEDNSSLFEVQNKGDQKQEVILGEGSVEKEQEVAGKSQGQLRMESDIHNAQLHSLESHMMQEDQPSRQTVLEQNPYIVKPQSKIHNQSLVQDQAQPIKQQKVVVQQQVIIAGSDIQKAQFQSLQAHMIEKEQQEMVVTQTIVAQNPYIVDNNIIVQQNHENNQFAEKHLVQPQAFIKIKEESEAQPQSCNVLPNEQSNLEGNNSYQEMYTPQPQQNSDPPQVPLAVNQESSEILKEKVNQSDPLVKINSINSESNNIEPSRQESYPSQQNSNQLQLNPLSVYHQPGKPRFVQSQMQEGEQEEKEKQEEKNKEEKPSKKEQSVNIKESSIINRYVFAQPSSKNIGPLPSQSYILPQNQSNILPQESNSKLENKSEEKQENMKEKNEASMLQSHVTPVAGSLLSSSVHSIKRNSQASKKSSEKVESKKEQDVELDALEQQFAEQIQGKIVHKNELKQRVIRKPKLNDGDQAMRLKSFNSNLSEKMLEAQVLPKTNVNSKSVKVNVEDNMYTPGEEPVRKKTIDKNEDKNESVAKEESLNEKIQSVEANSQNQGDLQTPTNQKPEQLDFKQQQSNFIEKKIEEAPSEAKDENQIEVKNQEQNSQQNKELEGSNKMEQNNLEEQQLIVAEESIQKLNNPQKSSIIEQEGIILAQNDESMQKSMNEGLLSPKISQKQVEIKQQLLIVDEKVEIKLQEEVNKNNKSQIIPHQHLVQQKIEDKQEQQASEQQKVIENKVQEEGIKNNMQFSLGPAPHESRHGGLSRQYENKQQFNNQFQDALSQSSDSFEARMNIQKQYSSPNPSTLKASRNQEPYPISIKQEIQTGKNLKYQQQRNPFESHESFSYKKAHPSQFSVRNIRTEKKLKGINEKQAKIFNSKPQQFESVALVDETEYNKELDYQKMNQINSPIGSVKAEYRSRNKLYSHHDNNSYTEKKRDKLTSKREGKEDQVQRLKLVKEAHKKRLERELEKVDKELEEINSKQKKMQRIYGQLEKMESSQKPNKEERRESVHQNRRRKESDHIRNMIRQHRKFKQQQELEFQDLDRNISNNLVELTKMRQEAQQKKKQKKRIQIMQRMKKNQLRKANEQKLARVNNKYVQQFRQDTFNNESERDKEDINLQIGHLGEQAEFINEFNRQEKTSSRGQLLISPKPPQPQSRTSKVTKFRSMGRKNDIRYDNRLA